MHLGITEKPTRGCISYVITVALSVVSEETATKNAENCRRQPHCRLTPPFQRSTCDYPYIPYILQTTPWAIKKGATIIFTITLANVDRFQ